MRVYDRRSTTDRIITSGRLFHLSRFTGQALGVKSDLPILWQFQNYWFNPTDKAQSTNRATNELSKLCWLIMKKIAIDKFLA